MRGAHLDNERRVLPRRERRGQRREHLQWLRGFKAHRLLYHSTLGLRVIGTTAGARVFKVHRLLYHSSDIEVYAPRQRRDHLQWFPCGLVFKAHRRMYHSTLGLCKAHILMYHSTFKAHRLLHHSNV